MNKRNFTQRGATLMEILVAAAIIVILLAIAVPVYSHFITRGYQATALTNLRNLGAAFANFTAENDGHFPQEDALGPNTWANAALAENQKVWYNALPHLLGQKSVGDYGSTPRAFYTKANVLFIPGAKYPPPEARLEKPIFAVAINSRLQRKNEQGIKADQRVTQVTQPASTVLFFEQGLKDEKKSYGAQGRYDGAPKGTARTFVGRYNGLGVICFFDGHAELMKPSDLLTPTGSLPFPQTDVIWTIDPLIDPN